MIDCVIKDGRCERCGKRGRDSVRRNCIKPGLGDLVEKALTFVGITKKRVERITGKPCGCADRQEALNTWGDRVLSAFRKQ